MVGLWRDNHDIAPEAMHALTCTVPDKLNTSMVADLELLLWPRRYVFTREAKPGILHKCGLYAGNSKDSRYCAAPRSGQPKGKSLHYVKSERNGATP